MTFINLFMLLALPAAALPVVIYYIVNRKRKVIRFAAFEWMMKAVVKRRKLNRIDDILKLIAKICLVIALIFFMARPAFEVEGAKNVLVVIDTTLSMSAKDLSGNRRIKLAAETAKGIAKMFDGAELAFASFDGKLSIFLEGAQKDGPFPGLDTLECSGRDAGFDTLVREFIEMPDHEKYDTICFISDFQASNYNDPNALKAEYKKLSGVRTVFIPAGDGGERISNVAVESFSIPEEGFMPGRNNRIRVVLANHSDTPAESVSAVLSVNGVKKDTSTVTVAPDSKAEIYLVLNTPPDKDSLVEISIPRDQLEADNSMFLVSHPRGRVNVLGIVPQNQPGAFKNDVFMKNALLASSDGGDLFRYTSMTPEQTISARLENYDAIFIFGVPLGETSSLAHDIMKYLATGHTVVSFSDLSTEKYWAGLGLDASVSVTKGSFTPDPDRLEGTYTAFMNDGHAEPEKFVFEKVSPVIFGGKTPPDIKISPKLVLKGLAAPAGCLIEHKGGKLILFGYVPVPEFTTSVFNGNFVRFVMRIAADAAGGGVFAAANGNDALAIPFGNEYSVTPGEALTLVLSSKAVPDPKTDIPERIDAKTARRISASGEKEGLYMMLENVPSTPRFTTVLRKDAELFKTGINPTRADSNLEPAKPEAFKEAADEGLIFKSAEDVLSGTASRESFSIALALLLMAVAFDIYAHFLRRR